MVWKKSYSRVTLWGHYAKTTWTIFCPFLITTADMFCCFHRIHNYHSLDHEFVIKSTLFGHFLYLSVIQKIGRVMTCQSWWYKIIALCASHSHSKLGFDLVQVWIFLDLQLWKVTVLQPLDLWWWIVAHLKAQSHIYSHIT